MTDTQIISICSSTYKEIDSIIDKYDVNELVHVFGKRYEVYDFIKDVKDLKRLKYLYRIIDRGLELAEAGNMRLRRYFFE